MNKKEIGKAIAYTAGAMALVAFSDFVIAYAQKDSRVYDLKDIHYEMESLQKRHHNNFVNGSFSKKEQEAIEKKLAQLRDQHAQLSAPIPTFFWGKISNKCKMCSEK